MTTAVLVNASVSPALATVVDRARPVAWPRRLRRSIAVPWATSACFGVAAAAAVLLAGLAGQVEAIGAGPIALSMRWFGGAAILPAGRFIALFAGSWVAGLATLLLFPRGLSERHAAALVLALAVSCRLALLAHPPSDDVNRYLWEGRAVRAGLSPYRHPPVAGHDPAADALRTAADPYWRSINHPEMTAIYPPLMLLFFAAVGAFSYTAMALKLVMTAFDIGTIALLLGLLRARQLDARWALLYALNPAVLLAFAGQGHLDVVQVFLLTAALLLYERRCWAWMFAVAGLAVQVKYVAIVGLPFLVRRDNLRYAWIALVTGALPFAAVLPFDGLAVFHSLTRFGTEFAYNGSLHWVLYPLMGGVDPLLRVGPPLFAVAWLWAIWRLHPERSAAPVADPAQGMFFSVGALLLLSPSIHFWYLSWVMALVVVRPAASWMVLSLTIAFGFVAEGNAWSTGAYHLPLWAQAGTWVVPLLLLGVELRRGALRLRVERPWPIPCSLSVVVPALNEAVSIAGCVASLCRSPYVREVVVVDGGSTDGTAARAVKAGARVVHHFGAAARGAQIRAGVRHANGDVVAVVHADTRVPPRAFAHILDVLAANPDVVGGAVGCVLDGPGWRLRALDIANAFRAALLGIAFGDQVQFFRRAPVIAGDLIPTLPLMEDVELSLRLRRVGRVVFLWGDARVSARAWRVAAGWRTVRIILLVAEYLCRRLRGLPNTDAMYTRYYAGTRSPTLCARPGLRLAAQ